MTKNDSIPRKPWIAALLSLLLPGAGQFYCGNTNRAARILLGAIIIVNINILVVPLIIMANPEVPSVSVDPDIIWHYWIPRFLHDLSALWSVLFWIGNAVDAGRLAAKREG